MAIGSRWVGLCCVLSAGLLAACDSKSKCEPPPNSCSALGGDSSVGGGGSSNSGAGGSNAGAGGAGAGNAAGSSNAGAGNAAGSSTAGEGNAGAGNAAGSNSGGSSQGGTSGIGAGGTSSGGSAGKASGGSAGTTQGGAGGTQGGDSCGGAQVLFLIQRSGALFEGPGLANTGEMLPLDLSYFGFLRAAFSGPDSVAKPYLGKLPMRVSFLFAARDLLVSPLPAVCPQLAETAPNLQFDAQLNAVFAQGYSDHLALSTAKLKVEAPVPEAIGSAVASWSAAGGARHLVLIFMGMPDTCNQFDGPCGLDATVKAVQDANAAGVITHVIGLGHDIAFNYPSKADPGVLVITGNEDYLQQLANAGSGKSVGPANVQQIQAYTSSACGSTLAATYSTAPGDAKYYQVLTATDAKTAVAGVLADICP